MNRNVATAIVSLVFAGPALAAQQTVVPAFFAINRKIDGNTPDWTRIANQRGAVLAVVALGGPNGIETCGYNGQGTCDAAAYHTQFGNNSGAGQKVLGYVDAGFACTQSSHLNDKLSDSQTGQYGVATWYSVYPTELQGIFFDRGPQFSTCSCSNCGPYDLNGQLPQANEPTQKNYYSEAYGYVGTNHSGATVMLNASQFENDWVINASDPNKSADYIVNYEQDFNTWWNTYKAEDGNTPTWWQSSTYLNASKLANVVYNTDQYTASDGITRSQDPNQPYKSPVMYFYDGSSKSYDHLTCSFEMQAAMLQGTTPVPTGKTYCPAIPAQGRLERCADLDSDPSDCQECGVVCPSTGHGSAICINAVCWFSCIAGYHPCDVGCWPNGQGCP